VLTTLRLLFNVHIMHMKAVMVGNSAALSTID
jgi:hypothetical protein